MKKCAYMYGTKANSLSVRSDSWQEVEDFHAAHPVGSAQRVWSLPTAEHCLVGVNSREDLVSAQSSADAFKLLWASIGLGVFLFCFCIFVGHFCRALNEKTETVVSVVTGRDLV